MVSNEVMRGDLPKWEEPKYNRIREQLRLENEILIGRGRGGLVGLAKAPGTKALRLFVSYCHADERVKAELLKHLEPLRAMQLIEAWHDRKLKAGEEWDGKISAELKKADIILLLISVDFINSKYCFEQEMDIAMTRHEAKEARVIPVIVRNCLWHSAPFSKLQALPKDAKPIGSWENEDDAFVDVATGIMSVAREIQEGR